MSSEQEGFILSNKKFILNADDFGMSNAFNKAVLDGYNHGFLTSASICANGKAFEPAVNEIIPECPNLSIGVHLNIIEGKSLKNNEKFNKSYFQLMSLSHNSSFLEETEKEFRLQIERVLKYKKPDHIDSHVHVHGIPKIFEIVCKLAKEYEIDYVRTQFEKFYLVPDIIKHLNVKYPPNIFKILLLNHFTFHNNRKLIKKYELKTNDYLIGVGYTGMMDDKTIYNGLCAIKEDDLLVEALIHPRYYKDKVISAQKEFMITQNMDLKDKIQRLGFEIGNYQN